MMNVRELRKHLEQYPEELEVLFCQYSDYVPMEPIDISVEAAVDKGGYMMRAHVTMSEDNHAKCKSYLVFPGN